MSEPGLVRYVMSCGVLTVPILVWNLALTRFLPPALASDEFSRDIPTLVTHGENTLRAVVMVLPFLMPLEVATRGQRRGVRLFVVGTIVYFLSWVPLMIVPQSSWSTSWVGFVAPAYTPLLWLAGLGLIGRRFYVPSPFRWWMYVGLACGFVTFHVTHASIVYARNYERYATTDDTFHSGSAPSTLAAPMLVRSPSGYRHNRLEEDNNDDDSLPQDRAPRVALRDPADRVKA